MSVRLLHGSKSCKAAIRRCGPSRFRCASLWRAVCLAGAAIGECNPAAADNGVGGWSTLAKWPLIPLHAILLPDGRVLSYGGNSGGQQTGRFIYDVWSPSQGMAADSHWTLRHTTG